MIKAYKLILVKPCGHDTPLYFTEKDVAERFATAIEGISKEGVEFEWDATEIEVLSAEDVLNTFKKEFKSTS